MTWEQVGEALGEAKIATARGAAWAKRRTSTRRSGRRT
jgi:hypothetical protein